MKSRTPRSRQRSRAAATTIAACLAVVMLAVAPVVSLAQAPSQNLPGFRKHFVGLPAGNFTLRNLNGREVSLSEFRGKTVVLSFWSTWCMPCQAELPVIQKIYVQDKDKNVVVLSVDDESRMTISDFLKKHHYGFMALVDPKGSLFRRFAVHFIPAVFVINSEGIIVSHIVGWHGPQPLLAAVKAAEQQNGGKDRYWKAGQWLAFINRKAEAGED